jgi:hypothetical protein
LLLATGDLLLLDVLPLAFERRLAAFAFRRFASASFCAFAARAPASPPRRLLICST